jgi:hypothetical protein
MRTPFAAVQGGRKRGDAPLLPATDQGAVLGFLKMIEPEIEARADAEVNYLGPIRRQLCELREAILALALSIDAHPAGAAPECARSAAVALRRFYRACQRGVPLGELALAVQPKIDRKLARGG